MGFLAKSKAGHDKGKIYFIIKSDEVYAYLTDGNIRKIDNPKKKKIKHIQIIKSDLLEDDITNEKVKLAIKNHIKSLI